MNFKIVGNNYNNHKDKLISLVNSLANNTELSTIFDIPSDVIEYIIEKNLNLSEYRFYGFLSTHAKQVVLFKNIHNRNLIILMKKYSKIRLCKISHKQLNVYPCELIGKYKVFPNLRNIKPRKDISEELTGKELQKKIEIIVRTNYF